LHHTSPYCGWLFFWPFLLSHDQFGHFGCHGFDELFLPMLRVEDLEAKTGNTQHRMAMNAFLPCWLVLAHKVQQSAHVPRGFVRLPTCLEKVDGFRSARVSSIERGASYSRRYRPWWTQGPSSVKGFPTWCADARDLVESRTAEEAPQLIGEVPLACRMCLGCFSIAVNQRLHLGVGGQGSGVRG